MSTTPTQFATTSSTPYFGRAWKLTILNNNGQTLTLQNTSFAAESLKVTWSAEMYALRKYACADITIYNLNQQTEAQLLALGALGFNETLAQGNTVALYAGYQNNFQAANLSSDGIYQQYYDPSTGGNGVYGAPQGIGSLIWTGRVFQPMWERENVTDFKVTLHCIIGYLEEAMNLVNTSIGPLATQRQVVQRIVTQTRNAMSVNGTPGSTNSIESITDLDTASRSAQYALAKNMYGRPGDYIDSIAKMNQLTYFLGPNGVNVRSLSEDSSVPPDLIFGPPLPPGITATDLVGVPYTPTLIGVPQQTQDGVVFTVLMDSRVKLGLVVQLNMSVIKQLPQYPGTALSILDKTNSYIVASYKHVGDTRGDAWYTEITGLTLNWWNQFAASNPSGLATN